MSIFDLIFAKPGPAPKAFTDQFAPKTPNGGKCWTCRQPVQWRKATTWKRYLKTEYGHVSKDFEDFESFASHDGGPGNEPLNAESRVRFWQLGFWEPDFDNSPGHEACAAKASAERVDEKAPNSAREMPQSEFEERCSFANLPLTLALKCTFTAFDASRIAAAEFVPMIDSNGEPAIGKDGKARISILASQNLLNILEKWEPKDPPLMLLGSPGIGKTHLLVALAAKWIRRRMKVRFHNASGFLSEYRALCFSSNEHEQARAKIMKDDALRADLVIIDDLGVNSNTPFSETIWYEILNFRMERKLPTFFTSNLELKGLKDTFDERFISRLKGSTRLFEVNGTDYRALGVTRQ